MENKNYQEDLFHIRNMMEKSSRFISLSGLSGVFAGVAAVIGATYFYFFLQKEGITSSADFREMYPVGILFRIILTALAILISAVALAILFTVQKSKRRQLPIWTAATKALVFNLLVPLAAGGLFCLGLIYHNLFGLLVPTTLVFYGLALVNAGNYTFSDIKILGYLEILLGVFSLFFLEYGLLVWMLGFGVLHIIYGLMMHLKYK